MKTNKIPMRDWSADDKPREKLMYKGKQVLSDAELLAILIGTGNKSESALEVCQKILKQNNNQLTLLLRQSIHQLMQFKGIGQAKAITIVAALELAKRLQLSVTKEVTKITCSRDVFKLMHPIIGDLPHEEFWFLLLNNSNKIIYRLQLSKGGLTQTIVDVLQNCFLYLKTTLKITIKRHKKKYQTNYTHQIFINDSPMTQDLIYV